MVAAAPAGIEPEALADLLAEPLGLEPGEPLGVELIEGGRSNITCLLRQGSRRWVMRRPPLGSRQPSAHSMRREFDVLAGLAATPVPAPRPLAIREGADGTELYAMEHVEGRVLRGPADVDLDPVEARRCSLALVETLAAIHAVDVRAAGLDGLGRPSGYVERQVRRWREQIEAGVEVSDETRELGRRLAAAVPRREAAALVHGDYRIDNVLLDRDDPARIVAVLDWEMATVGDPLADLGMLLMYWRRPGEACASEVHAITQAEGFAERDELVAAYERATGADLSDLDFFVVLAHFKLAVIVAGIRMRHRRGETVGGGFEQVEEIPEALAAAGLEVAAGSGSAALRGEV